MNSGVCRCIILYLLFAGDPMFEEKLLYSQSIINLRWCWQILIHRASPRFSLNHVSLILRDKCSPTKSYIQHLCTAQFIADPFSYNFSLFFFFILQFLIVFYCFNRYCLDFSWSVRGKSDHMLYLCILGESSLQVHALLITSHLQLHLIN